MISRRSFLMATTIITVTGATLKGAVSGPTFTGNVDQDADTVGADGDERDGHSRAGGLLHDTSTVFTFIRSQNFFSNSGSFDSLNFFTTCGFRPFFDQIAARYCATHRRGGPCSARSSVFGSSAAASRR